MEKNDLILSLRKVIYNVLLDSTVTEYILQELYPIDYYSIDWPAQRNNVSKADLYSPHTRILDELNFVLSAYEQFAIPSFRRAGMIRA